MMMERTSLGVLYLSGWLISSACPLHQYHYVPDLKTWTEAQTYCRETYTDLATIENTEEMNQLIDTVSSLGYNFEVWIGPFSNIHWRWSDDTGADFRSWERFNSDEPDFKSGDEFCVASVNGAWWDDDCSMEYPFICNNAAGTLLDPGFVFVNESRTWSSAQRYCRENFLDLATVKNDAENQEIKNLVPNGDRAWIGLFRDPNIRWSDKSGSSFRYWADLPNRLERMSVVCGVAALQLSGRWRAMSCDMRLPSVCYSVPPPVKRQVVKLRMELQDSSVDLNDPAVKADILRKLQEKLEEKGVSGVTLTWRELPDGKVFHKEGKSAQKINRKNTEL